MPCYASILARPGCLFISFFINKLRPKQNGRRFPDDIFKHIFLNENCFILMKISLKSVARGPSNNAAAFVQIMAWRRSGDKLLSEPMMVSLPTHICVTRPQWVKNPAIVESKSNVIYLLRSAKEYEFYNTVTWYFNVNVLCNEMYGSRLFIWKLSIILYDSCDLS